MKIQDLFFISIHYSLQISYQNYNFSHLLPPVRIISAQERRLVEHPKYYYKWYLLEGSVSSQSQLSIIRIVEEINGTDTLGKDVDDSYRYELVVQPILLMVGPESRHFGVLLMIRMMLALKTKIKRRFGGFWEICNGIPSEEISLEIFGNPRKNIFGAYRYG